MGWAMRQYSFAFSLPTFSIPTSQLPTNLIHPESPGEFNVVIERQVCR
jgi:hypothetical protein